MFILEKSFHIFDSHEESEQFVIDSQQALSPSERVALCCAISYHGWKLQNPTSRIVPLREDPNLRIGSLDEPAVVAPKHRSWK